MITIARLIVALSGLWLLAVSALMLARPQLALAYLAKMGSTNLINYTELLLRLVWGIALVLVAEASLFPTVFSLIGWFIAATAVLLILVPRIWHARYAVYWSQTLTTTITRLCAPFSLAFGLFLIYAVH